MCHLCGIYAKQLQAALKSGQLQQAMRKALAETQVLFKENGKLSPPIAINSSHIEVEEHLRKSFNHSVKVAVVKPSHQDQFLQMIQWQVSRLPVAHRNWPTFLSKLKVEQTNETSCMHCLMIWHKHWDGRHADKLPSVEVGWPGPEHRGSVFSSVAIDTRTSSAAVQKSLEELMSWKCSHRASKQQLLFCL